MVSIREGQRIKNVAIDVIKEDDGSYAIACPALGVYSVGSNLREAKKSFSEALDLHLGVLKERALKALAQRAPA